MKEPKSIVIARRGQSAIAALILMQTDNDLALHAFSFTDETIATAPTKAFEYLGIEPEQHLNMLVFVVDIPEAILDAHVVAKFAAAVQANDTAYFYSLTNSKGGKA